MSTPDDRNAPWAEEEAKKGTWQRWNHSNEPTVINKDLLPGGWMRAELPEAQQAQRCIVQPKAADFTRDP